MNLAHPMVTIQSTCQIFDNNDFLGIIIKDMKSSDVIITYTAKVARIIDVEDQIILEMETGKYIVKIKFIRQRDKAKYLGV